MYVPVKTLFFTGILGISLSLFKQDDIYPGFDRYFNEEYSLDCDTIWLIQNSLSDALIVMH